MESVGIAVWAEIGTAIGTLLLAFGTFYMAWQTQRLAKETGETLAQSDRQHQESYMPLLKLVGFPVVSGNFNGPRIEFNGRIINKGPGPALSVSVQYHFISLGPIFDTDALPPLGTDEDVGIEKEWPADGAFIEPLIWTIELRCDNIFGSEVTTTYSSDEPNAPTFTPPKPVQRSEMKR
jgi:hypothetical protein